MCGRFFTDDTRSRRCFLLLKSPSIVLSVVLTATTPKQNVDGVCNLNLKYIMWELAHFQKCPVDNKEWHYLAVLLKCVKMPISLKALWVTGDIDFRPISFRRHIHHFPQLIKFLIAVEECVLNGVKKINGWVPVLLLTKQP